ncbi:PepSY domain-containing protein [Novosphingobium aquae]|uniref:PepSY domain-containing protein n=1 Tax=Novosphingobium aquae TaxID=3133435 RepID=A0ABU8SCA8_9SPHN
MRKLRRWVSFPLILLLLLVSVTGVVLQGEEIAKIGAEQSPPPRSDLPEEAALAAMVQKAAAAARQLLPDLPVQSVALDFSRGQQKARFGVTPRGGPSVEVDMKSGEARWLPSSPPRMNVTMIQLHTGKFGPFGLVLMGIASLVFLVLTVTGFKVYYDMCKHRRKLGKPRLFWK